MIAPCPESSDCDRSAAPAQASSAKPRWMLRNGWGVFALTLFYSVAAISALSLTTNVEVYHRWSVFYKTSVLMLLVNIAIFQSVLVLLHAFLNRWMLAATIWTLLIGGLAVPNIVKLMMLNRPLLPWDFYLVGQMISLVPVMKPENNVLFGCIAGLPFLVILLFYWSYRPRNIVVSMRYRRLVGAIHLAALAAIIFSFAGLRESDAANDSVSISRWNQKQNYDRNGFLFSFLYNAAHTMREGARPKNYSEQAVARTIQHDNPVRSGYRASATEAGGEPVNVIMILLEAFSDPALIPAQYSEDPIPFVHSLQKTASAGALTVPTFGGYTSRTEFEALTGFSLHYLYEVSNPYTAYVHRALPALPQFFKDNGYRTVAIHTYTADFWERDRVYPLFGFDKFIDQSQIENPKYSGPFISDETMVDKIIETSQGAGPYFIFGVTMSTHAPFKYETPVDEPIDVLSPLSPASKGYLKTYVNAVHRTDVALKRLVEHYSQDKRKTMILFFGDHLPMLGDNKEVYLETGMIKDPDDMPEKMYRTPVVAWANFDLPRQSLDRRASFLYSYVAQSAGLPATPLASLNAIEARENPRLDDVKLNRDYDLLQYDMIFGNQYALQPQFNPASTDPGQRGIASRE